MSDDPKPPPAPSIEAISEQAEERLFARIMQAVNVLASAQGERLSALEERMDTADVERGALKEDMVAVTVQVKEFHEEWRDSRRWWRKQAETVIAESCRAIKTIAERMTPWPLVVVLVVGMLLAAGVQTFGGRVAGQEFHVGQAGVNASDDAGISGAARVEP